MVIFYEALEYSGENTPLYKEKWSKSHSFPPSNLQILKFGISTQTDVSFTSHSIWCKINDVTEWQKVEKNNDNNNYNFCKANWKKGIKYALHR